MYNDLYNELSTNFIEYAVAVNSDRAIPDAKSGLKPVAKRILYGAYEGGRSSSKPHVKCARIVGDVMGNWHPHGDSSIYGALVRLSQPWVMRYPLIDFHGNQGNIGGDGPAASRYTEARLNKLSEQGMLNGLKKKNVDFIPNYDDTLEEPVTLPAVFPNLLCNPNTGIGVAMACNWLPHNLIEVGDAIVSYLDGKEPTLPGPDFPTGGTIINVKDIPLIMKTGHGSVKVRGNYKIEKNNIVFTEIPYGVGLEALMSEIGKYCDEGEFEEVSHIRDESNKKGLRLVIECKYGTNPESVVKRLFAKTNLQTSISYNQVALINKTPTELNLKDCIEVYVNHNIDCLIKEWNYDLIKAKDRLHIVDGLLIALEDIDNVIALIKKSADSKAAKKALIEKYKLSEIQAKSILAMRLSSLAHMEKMELENEKKELLALIDDLNYALSTPARQKEEVKTRLQNIVKKFGDKRRTKLTQIDIKPEEKEIEEVIPEDVVVVLTQTGDIKRIAAKSFKPQRRGGKGVKSLNNAILESISTNTLDTLMFFTDKGRMYKTIVDKVPAGTNAKKGTYVGELINLEPGEKVVAMSSLNRKTNFKYVVFLTKKGYFKKTYLEEYTKLKKSIGIKAIKLNEEDSIVKVFFLNEEEVLLFSKQGMAIHFETKNINPIGRVSMGVKTLKMNPGDEILTGLVLKNKTDKVAIFTEHGFGKKTSIEEYPVQGRCGKGVFYYRITPMSGQIVGVEMVSDEDYILLVGPKNNLCFSAQELPLLSRNGVGNIMIRNGIEKIVKI